MHDVCFNGNQPRIMHFERVKVGDHYSVSPEATLGPTQGAKGRTRVREQRRRESQKRAIKKRLASLEGEESKRIASQWIQEFESRQFEGSRVREFELDSGVIPTVKSEINKREWEIKWLSL
jgi:hypothetical protein